MFYKLVGVIIFSLMLSSCSTLTGMAYNEGNGFIIKQEGFSGVNIEYQHENYLRQEQERLNDLRMTNESINLARAGLILITSNQLTIGAANTKWLEYVLFDQDGNEIKRKRGTDKIANVPIGTSPYATWWNIDSFTVPYNVQAPFKFVVINHITNRKVTFTISPPK